MLFRTAPRHHAAEPGSFPGSLTNFFARPYACKVRNVSHLPSAAMTAGGSHRNLLDRKGNVQQSARKPIGTQGDLRACACVCFRGRRGGCSASQREKENAPAISEREETIYLHSNWLRRLLFWSISTSTHVPYIVFCDLFFNFFELFPGFH